MIGTSITTLFVVCVVSIALCAFFYFRCVDLECKVDVLQASKDDLRESMSNTNYYLHQQLERVKGWNEALRTQLHQLRKERQDLTGEVRELKSKLKEAEERIDNLEYPFTDKTEEEEYKEYE